MNKLLYYIYKQVTRWFSFVFPGSARYWEKRYSKGKNSGAGSYGKLAAFKAEVLNQFVKENNIQSVIEFGCGDGYQLSLFEFPHYTGLDISERAIEICRNKFINDQTKRFYKYPSNRQVSYNADLALSLDVIYHLVEDEVFEKYVNDLFLSAQKYVIIYSSNFDGKQYFHERDRCFTRWIDKNISGWNFVKKIKNKYPYNEINQNETSKADFYIYMKTHKE
ncbi:MAG: class I SAM-dependent methyltransferase [Flavobacteriales bacterium]|nr:class I SAM-dependent methyltransferase [Flavobacteriales bacterium]